ncbi:MAG: flagellar motor protein MotD [Thermodesulfobacteriota bacterium]
MMRRKKPEEHENHERWLVSYADFITLLFAFFVVMYAISSVNEGKYKTLSAALIEAFQSTPGQPVSIQSADQTVTTGIPVVAVQVPSDQGDPAQEEKMRGIANDILKVMEPLIQEGQVTVTQSRLGVCVEINAGVLFQPGQAELGEKPVEVLKAVAYVVATVPDMVMVEGHTDNIPISSTVYPSNWELSSARASSVVRLFIENGVAPGRLMAVGYADQRPVGPNDTNEARAKNRRVTIRIEPNDKTENEKPEDRYE